MKFSELKKGMKVYDRWYPDWGTGKVYDLTKTGVLITFEVTEIAYDKAHVQFLSRKDKSND